MSQGFTRGVAIDTDPTLNANSNQLVPSQAAVVSYVSLLGGGTVLSVGQTFTGGLISVSGSPITSAGTLALAVAGTSGGVPYFSSASSWASSALLVANGVMLGGGAGAPPSTLALGTARQTLEMNTGATAPQWTSWAQMKQTVDSGVTMTIDSGYSTTIAGPITNSGTISNSGTLLVI